MTEYSVEEVRAEADRHARVFDEVPMRMLNAYADLLERIKADEAVVPGWSAQRTQHPALGGLWAIRPPSGNNVFVEDGDKSSGAEVLRELARSLVNKATSGTFACPICGDGKPHRHSGEDVAKHRGAESYEAPEPITHPPAQAAQVEARTIRPCRVDSRDFPTGSLVQQVIGRADACYDRFHDRPSAETMARVDACKACGKPWPDYASDANSHDCTAEPVAQGEAEASDIDATALQAAQEIALMWGLDRSQFVAKIQVRIIDVLRRFLAAQPRAVPDGWKAVTSALVSAAELMISEIDTCGHEVDPAYRLHLYEAKDAAKALLAAAPQPGESA